MKNEQEQHGYNSYGSNEYFDSQEIISHHEAPHHHHPHSIPHSYPHSHSHSHSLSHPHPHQHQSPPPHSFKFKHFTKPDIEIKTSKIKHHPSIEITEVKAPDLSKFKPVSAQFDYSKYIDGDEMNEGEYYVGHPQKGGFKGFKGATIKKIPVKPLITPGLGHFGSFPKFSSRIANNGGRSDYSSYFRARNLRDGQRDASKQIVQSMMRKQKAPVPRYASGSASSYFL